MDTKLPLSLKDYSGLEGEPFSVTGPGTLIEARLIETKAMGQGLRDGGAFALLWQGPAAPALVQATYQVMHEATGPQDIFLVPVTKNDEGFCYEAVFT